MARHARTAHPYRDTDVIDSRAPRFNQAAIGLLALAGVVTGWWPLLAVGSLQLVLGLTLGRPWCLACVAYFELVQPRIGEGELEDSRPPRFANTMGAVVLGVAAIGGAMGLSLVSALLGLAVAVLALLAATTGFCTGCEMYKIAARMRGVGVGGGHIGQIDPTDIAEPLEDDTVVEFTHPLCSDCRRLERRLRDAGRRVVTIDVRSHPDLARKYGVGVVPTAVSVDAAGAVRARLA
jgi:hypothetical protein